MDGNNNSPFTTDSSTVDGNAGKKKKRKIRVSVKGQSRQVRTDRCNKRNKGEEFKTGKGKVVMARKIKQLGSCRRKCNELFKDDDRKIIFEEYWSMGDYAKRVSYVMALINLKQKMTERKKVDISEKQRNRTFSREYFLLNGEKKKICCSCFLSTLGETKGFLNTVVAKCISSKSGIPQNDLRGKREPHNKLSEQDLKNAKDHILSIPSYESHYSRRDTSKRYLPSHFTLSSLYEQYKQTTDTPIGRPKYEAIFHDLNLSIKKPKRTLVINVILSICA